jgi:hypothetical protein
MKTSKEAIAYHEAGHAMAYILLGKKFMYATIRENDTAAGHIRQRSSRISLDTYINSMIVVLGDFPKLFLHDFINIAGFTAEAIHTGKFNGKRALSDFMGIVDTTTQDLPERFVKQYMEFLSGYAMLVFQIKVNWLRIEAIAEALIEKETLTYIETIEVAQNAMLSHINN